MYYWLSKVWYPYCFHRVADRTLLPDIAPTVLDFLQQPAMKKIDGNSLKPYLFSSDYRNLSTRPLFIETGHTITEIQK